MADLAAIRAELAAALNTLPDGRAEPYRPDTINPPLLVVEPDEVNFKGAFGRGAEMWVFRVIALLGTVQNLSAQKLRDEFFGGIRDVHDAIEDHDYGTAADDVEVVRAESFDTLTVSGVDYLGVFILVQVIA